MSTLSNYTLFRHRLFLKTILQSLILVVLIPAFSGCFGSSFIIFKHRSGSISDGEDPVLPPRIVSKIQTGEHSCIAHDRGMHCWGRNSNGQIAVPGATANVEIPLEVFSNQIIETVTVGSTHTCIQIDGGVQCVGGGASGQLGQGVFASSLSFVTVFPSGSQVTGLSTAGSANCAVVAGGLFCWGNGANYQIGDGTNSNRNVPVQIFAPGSGVTKVAVGDFHTCALVANEQWCWGRNTYGQVGDGTFIDKSAPVKIVSIGVGVSDIHLGERHACSIKDGGLFCWGYNTTGQVGDNSIINRNSPVAIYPASSGVTAISLGVAFTCAMVNSELKCWGSNANGQLNDAVSNVSKLTPYTVLAASHNITHFSSGRNNVCVVKAFTTVSCWGGGALGNGSSGNSLVWPTPEDVVGLASNVQRLAKVDLLFDDSNNQNCAIHNGGVKCWGTNGNGILGDGTVNSSMVPVVAIPELSGVTDLAIIAGTSNASSCAVINGGVQCWGSGYGNSPIQIIAAASSATSVNITQYNAVFDDYGCAVVNGGVQCWGVNTFGQLGNGTTVASPTIPVVAIAAAAGAIQVEVRAAGSCAIVNGGLQCWGYNDSGQLGDGTLVQRNSPIQTIAAASGVTDVIIVADWDQEGLATTCAVVAGGLKCWGYNTDGLVGDGTTTNRLVPVDIFPAASGVTAVNGGNNTLCAIKNSGLYCWGNNQYAALGVGDKLNKLTPTLVISEGSGVTDFDIFSEGGCAIVSSGLKCWGNNSGGMVGDGTTTERLTPVTIYPPGSNVQDVSLAYDTVACVIINGAQKCWGSDSSLGLIGNGKVTRGEFSVVGFN